MGINERINSIKEYFLHFNVENNIATVLVKFPTKWTLLNKKDIENEFEINIEPKPEGIYFLCDISGGFDGLFNAIDYIIKNNKSLEEKTSLLNVKISELSEIFMREPLEKLKTLEFTFPKRANSKTKKNKIEDVATEKIEEEPQVVAKIDPVVKPIVDKGGEKKNKGGKQQTTQIVEDSSLVEFAKDILDVD